ncbi:Clavaminate synthase-like protein [Zopfia rhizophila CBS 207.26]|uniref:Clavaminate synthase-like protein n=1 Tax=Zopfia rhizophila CBS 207.26 TaxID=1314779 RepID=A0A6A6EGT6_9PEZI|nr:Clavaminate synthase-like protein [Zopfia rhizophila CBS 207.26]
MTTSITDSAVQQLKLDSTSSTALAFESFDLSKSNQRILGARHPPNTVTPLALRPSTHNATPDLDTVIRTTKSFQAQNEPHETIGIVMNRPESPPNVAPAKEARKEVLIYNHNESPQVPHTREYVFFHSHRAACIGGETLISSSLELFHCAKEGITEKGVLSKFKYKVEKQYEGWSTLKQEFGKEVVEGDSEKGRKGKVERQIRRYGRGEYTSWEWSDEGRTLTLTHHRQKATQQLFGDGTLIPEKYLKKLAEITDEIRVLHKWQEDDVLVYDNVIPQHGRQPWEGRQEDRVVMARLFDGESVSGAYSENEWAQVVQALPTSRMWR